MTSDDLSSLAPVGIIAGRGALPEQVAASCREHGVECYCFPIRSELPQETPWLQDYPHEWMELTRVGGALEAFRARHIRTLVMAGHVTRPSFRALAPDRKGAALLAKLAAKAWAGDDAILRVVVEFLEKEGFAVAGPERFAGSLPALAGVLTQAKPEGAQLEDIQLGLRAAKALGALDIGQAVAVQQGRVLGVEAAEGTAALIARCGPLQFGGGGAVLVKAVKPAQEKRVDLPAVGPETVKGLVATGFSGLAVEAGQVLLLERGEMIRQADEAGLFITGVTACPGEDR